VQRNGLVWLRRGMQSLGSVIGPHGEWRPVCKCSANLGEVRTRHDAINRLLDHLNEDEPDTTSMLAGLEPSGDGRG
jgi:hypothetical protein